MFFLRKKPPEAAHLPNTVFFYRTRDIFCVGPGLGPWPWIIMIMIMSMMMMIMIRMMTTTYKN